MNLRDDRSVGQSCITISCIPAARAGSCLLQSSNNQPLPFVLLSRPSSLSRYALIGRRTSRGRTTMKYPFALSVYPCRNNNATLCSRRVVFPLSSLLTHCLPFFPFSRYRPWPRARAFRALLDLSHFIANFRAILIISHRYRSSTRSFHLFPSLLPSRSFHLHCKRSSDKKSRIFLAASIPSPFSLPAARSLFSAHRATLASYVYLLVLVCAAGSRRKNVIKSRLDCAAVWDTRSTVGRRCHRQSLPLFSRF